MPKDNSTTLVIFGATGNLYSDKLAKALFLLFEDNKLPKDFKVLAFARKDMSSDDFRALTKESILKRGEVDRNKLEEFVQYIEYFKGELLEERDFVKLKDYLRDSSPAQKTGQILLHVATPSVLYQKIFENIKEANFKEIDGIKILIEKPFGKDEAEAMLLEKILTEVFEKENIFHIDHYLAKETALNILTSQDKDLSEPIEKIKVTFNESNVVGSRGDSYDEVGAFRDVGQNHVLEILALVIIKKLGINTGDIQKNRLEVLETLHIDKQKTPTKAQYGGYLLHPGVSSHSKTETFFRVFLKSNKEDLSMIEIELEGGKGLVDMKSDITPTTVCAEIYFKNKEKVEFKIQPVPGTVYESYTRVYTDAFLGNQNVFVSIEEVIAEWEITDEVFKAWEDVPLKTYSQGSKPEEIN
ncbi:MAG: hypothetical protein AAB510_02990 [Patescibacteria group bacterium]